MNTLQLDKGATKTDEKHKFKKFLKKFKKI